MNKLRKMALRVCFLNDNDQVKFMKYWVSEIKGNKNLIDKIVRIVTSSEDYRRVELDRWLENRIQKDYNIKTEKLINECIYYKKVKVRMKPYLRNLIRKIKERVRMRNKRIRDKSMREVSHEAKTQEAPPEY